MLHGQLAFGQARADPIEALGPERGAARKARGLESVCWRGGGRVTTAAFSFNVLAGLAQLAPCGVGCDVVPRLRAVLTEQQLFQRERRELAR